MSLRRWLARWCSVKTAATFLLCMAVVYTFDTIFRGEKEGMLHTDPNSNNGYFQIMSNQNGGHRKQVLLLAYQRVGSSFLGQIFNQSPEVFYLFEPIDSMYSAMYGTQAGYAVPSDIRNLRDGNERNITIYESVAISAFLSHLMTCEFHKVPTEVLINRFFTLYKFHQKRLTPFIECFKSKDLVIEKCQKYIRDHCVERFGFDPVKEEYCFKMLGYFQSSREDDDNSAAFEKYHGCMEHQRRLLSDCMPDMFSVCRKSSLSVVKTVRLTMQTAEYMVRKISDLRVIHLIRDPRGVALSRDKDPSFKGMFANGSISREAQLYCTNVVTDIRVRKAIEALRPGCCLEVIYENLVKNPLQEVKRIYSFLNITLHPDVTSWLRHSKEAAGEKFGIKIANKWQKQLSQKNIHDINTNCRKFFNEVKYPWAKLSL